jgi:hypothetical protein
MISTCQYCKKEYQAKRRGGRFCSVSCRVLAWEKAKQPGEAGWIYRGEELYLARKLEAFMKGASGVLKQVKELPAEEAGELMRVFLVQTGWGEGNSVVEGVLKKSGQPSTEKEG